MSTIKLSQKSHYNKYDEEGNLTEWKKGSKPEAWYVIESNNHPKGVNLSFTVGKCEVEVILSKADLNDLVGLVNESAAEKV